MTALARLSPDDIAEIMRLERGEGYEGLVGRWEAEEHRAEMSKVTSGYVGFRNPAGGLDGFVMFQELDRPVALLRRIAVGTPGQGVGGRLLQAAVSWAFAQSPYTGVRLQVRDINARARRAYEREGFAFTGNDEGDHLEMLVNRTAWEAR